VSALLAVAGTATETATAVSRPAAVAVQYLSELNIKSVLLGLDE
jgi:hypothetical protein